MNIQDIKKEALYFLNKNKQKMINVCLIIGVISSLSSLLPITGPYMALGHIATLLLLPLSYGLTTSALKLISGRENEVDEVEDGLVMFKRFTDIYPTALLVNVIMFLPAIIIGIWLLVTMGAMLATNPQSIAYTIGKHFGLWMLVLLACLAFFIYVGLGLSLVTYVMESRNLRGMKAIGTAWNMMAGHRQQLFAMTFSYFGWMFLEYAISSLGAELGVPLLGSLLAAVFAAYTYQPKMYTAYAIFYGRLTREQNM